MALQSLNGMTVYPLDAGYIMSGSGFATLALDAAEERVCAVVQFPQTGTVKKVGFYVSARTAGDAIYRVTLETVATTVGIPIAATYAGRTLYVANAESADVSIPGAVGVQWVAINGATGVSVTRGDLVSITIRCVTRTTGSMTVAYTCYSSSLPNNVSTLPYAFYNTGSDQTQPFVCDFALEYDGEIVPVPGSLPAVKYSASNWDSGDDPTFRGLKFKLPFPATVGGVLLGGLDADYDFKIHAYDSDEYTEFSGFPITVQQEQRRIDSAGNLYRYIFPTGFTVAKDTFYRIALEPIETGASNLNWSYMSVTDDGAVPAMAGVDGGVNFMWTEINDAPTSGSKVWTDTATDRPFMGLLISGLDDGAGGAGGGRQGLHAIESGAV